MLIHALTGEQAVVIRIISEIRMEEQTYDNKRYQHRSRLDPMGYTCRACNIKRNLIIRTWGKFDCRVQHIKQRKKAEYNEKKLCQVIGTGMLAATVATLVIELGKSVLSAWVIYIYIGFVILDCVVMIILAQKICKK